MSKTSKDDWTAIISQLNSTLVESDRWRDYFASESLSTGWCGMPPAPEIEIVRAEQRLGVTFPPSYRSFLSVSNGVRPFNSFIERLLSVGEIERYQNADPDDSALIQELYQVGDVPDDIYLDCETPKNNMIIRPHYYPTSLLVGKKWESGGGELVLLNPHVVFPDGEWETIFFANWIPGNQRYRSFYEFVRESIADLKRIEASRSS